MSTKANNTKGRILLIILLSILLLAGGLHLYFTQFADKLLEKLLVRIIEEVSPDDKLSFSKISYHFLEGELNVRDFYLSRSDSTENFRKKFSFKKLTIKGINPLQLFPGQKLSLRSIELDSPFFDTVEKKKRKEGRKKMIERLYELNVRKIIVRNASMNIQNEKIRDTLRNINFRLSDFQPDSLIDKGGLDYLIRHAELEIGDNLFRIDSITVSFSAIKDDHGRGILVENLDFRDEKQKSVLQKLKSQRTVLKWMRHTKTSELQLEDVDIGLAFGQREKDSSRHHSLRETSKWIPGKIVFNNLNLSVYNQKTHIKNQLGNLYLSADFNKQDSSVFPKPQQIQIISGQQKWKLSTVDAIDFEGLNFDLAQKSMSLEGANWTGANGSLAGLGKLSMGVYIRFSEKWPDSIFIEKLQLENAELRLRKSTFSLHMKEINLRIDSFAITDLKQHPFKLQESLKEFSCSDFEYYKEGILKSGKIEYSGKQLLANHLIFNNKNNSFKLNLSDVQIPDIEIFGHDSISLGICRVGSVSAQIRNHSSTKTKTALPHISMQALKANSIEISFADGSKNLQSQISGLNLSSMDLRNGNLLIPAFYFDSISFQNDSKTLKASTGKLMYSAENQSVNINKIDIGYKNQTGFYVQGDIDNLDAFWAHPPGISNLTAAQKIRLSHGKIRIESDKSPSGTGNFHADSLQQKVNKFFNSLILKDFEICFTHKSKNNWNICGSLRQMSVQLKQEQPLQVLELTDCRGQSSGSGQNASLKRLYFNAKQELFEIDQLSANVKGLSPSLQELFIELRALRAPGFSFQKDFSPDIRDLFIDSLKLEARLGKKNSKGKTKGNIRKYLPQDKLDISNMNLDIRQESGQEYQLEQVSINADNLEKHLKSGDYNKIIEQLRFKSAGIQFKNQHRLRLYGFAFENSSLQLDSLLFRPDQDRFAFQKAQIYQTDWTLIRARDIVFGDFLFTDESGQLRITSDTLRMSGFYLDDYRDKRLPMPVDRYPLLPGEMLKKLPFQLCIRHLETENAFIAYSEHEKKAKEAGRIFFNDMDIKMLNICNIPERIAENPHLGISTSFKLVGVARADAGIRINLNDPQQHFRMGCYLQAFDMTEMNPVLENLAFLKIHSGKLNSLQFTAKGNKDVATGQMDFLYDDLKIRIIDRKTLKQTFGDHMLAFFANTFVVKKNNPSVLIPREGPMYFERDNRKSVFNYWAKLIMSGVKTSIGFEKNKTEKKIKKLEND